VAELLLLNAAAVLVLRDRLVLVKMVVTYLVPLMLLVQAVEAAGLTEVLPLRV
jgi:hypothetical protein